MKITLAVLALFLVASCETTQSLGPEVYVQGTGHLPNAFQPWKPADPYDLEGVYLGERDGSEKWMRLALVQSGNSFAVTGTLRTGTPGQASGEQSFPATTLRAGLKPGFDTAAGPASFVTFTDPHRILFREPVDGLIIGDLFYLRQ